MLVGSRNLDSFVLLGLHRVSQFDTIYIKLCGFVANQVLVHGWLSAMLSNLDDPSALGPGMALALVTTLYGSVMAQLIFIPIADKLEMKSDLLRNNMALIVDSVMGIYNGMNPQVLDELLETYLPEYQRGAMDMNEEVE